MSVLAPRLFLLRLQQSNAITLTVVCIYPVLETGIDFLIKWQAGQVGDPQTAWFLLFRSLLVSSSFGVVPHFFHTLMVEWLLFRLGLRGLELARAALGLNAAVMLLVLLARVLQVPEAWPSGLAFGTALLGGQCGRWMYVRGLHRGGEAARAIDWRIEGAYVGFAQYVAALMALGAWFILK